MFKRFAPLTFAILSANLSVAAQPAPAQTRYLKDQRQQLEFTLGGGAAEIGLVTYSREKLKGTTKTQGDFHQGSHFSVEVAGKMIGGIEAVEGLQDKHDVIEYRDGDDGPMHQRPGRTKPGKVTIHREFSGEKAFVQWRKSVLDGKTDRRTVTITQFNDADEPQSRINGTGCIPVLVSRLESSVEQDSRPKELVRLECLDLSVEFLVRR